MFLGRHILSPTVVSIDYHSIFNIYSMALPFYILYLFYGITFLYSIFILWQGGTITCDSDTVECYVLDNNGFVVISEDKLNTGKFFGEIDGTVLNSLVKNNVFRRIKVYDYQVRDTSTM